MLKKIIDRYYPGEINKAQKKAYEIAEVEFNRKIDQALEEQRGIYDLKIVQLNSEITILNKIIDERKKRVDDAIGRELNSRNVLLKAQELINQVDYEFRNHVENNARTMVRFKEIRKETELFARQLIPQS